MINDLWYKNAVIYCLSVGTYMDANGDGIGDFQGLMRRLDYLHGLGVTAIWLMPFQTSPCRDDGYDISDYYAVDPRYGTLGDFVEFTHGAKQRGIRVLIDLVVNHTSNEHPWFQEARARPELEVPRLVRLVEDEAAERQRGHGLPRRAEDDLDATTRSPRPITSTASTSSSPTSTPRTREVQAEILKIMGFWIQLGVSGFRMDAVPFVIGTKGAGREASPTSSTTCCATFREFLQWRAGRRDHPRRGERAARDRHGVLRRRRRPHAHDVQLPGQPAPVLRARRGRHAARSSRR